MKIDFPPVRCFDEAVIFPGVKVLDAAVPCFRMMLHLTAKFAHDVFDLSHCSVEGLPDRDQRVFALGRVGRGLVDDDLVCSGNSMRSSTSKPPRRCPVCGPVTTTRQLVMRGLNFSRRCTCEATRDRNLFGRVTMPKGDVD